MSSFPALQALWQRHVPERGFAFAAAPRAVQALASVITVQGIVGNGGFEYLFEADLQDDPGYRLSLEAYRLIGAIAEFEAFERALGLFDAATVQDKDARNVVLDGLTAEARADLGRLAAVLWDGEEAVFDRLLHYCEAHGLQP